MKVDTSTAGLSREISSRLNQDRADLRQIGQELKSTETKYRNAIKSGDETAIAEAQMDYEKSAQKFKAQSEIQGVINRLINSIIEKIGQIGR